jgi:hypothetical protein
LRLATDFQNDAGALATTERHRDPSAKQIRRELRHCVVEQRRKWNVERNAHEIHRPSLAA